MTARTTPSYRSYWCTTAYASPFEDTTRDASPTSTSRFAHLGDDDAAVLNACANLDVEVGDASRVVSSKGEAYAVVHQYDRYDGVVRAVASRWPFSSS